MLKYWQSYPKTAWVLKVSRLLFHFVRQPEEELRHATYFSCTNLAVGGFFVLHKLVWVTHSKGKDEVCLSKTLTQLGTTARKMLVRSYDLHHSKHVGLQMDWAGHWTQTAFDISSRSTCVVRGKEGSRTHKIIFQFHVRKRITCHEPWPKEELGIIMNWRCIFCDSWRPEWKRQTLKTLLILSLIRGSCKTKCYTCQWGMPRI